MSLGDTLKLSCGVCGGTLETVVWTLTNKERIIQQFDEAHEICKREHGNPLRKVEAVGKPVEKLSNVEGLH